jgi:hypothetical protein
MNNGNRWIWTPEYTPPVPIGNDDDGGNSVRIVDLNGDSLPDMVWNKPGDKGAVINTGCGWKNDNEFASPYEIANSNGKDLGVRFVDLNGDGAVDIIRNLKKRNGQSEKGAKFGKKNYNQQLYICESYCPTTFFLKMQLTKNSHMDIKKLNNC